MSLDHLAISFYSINEETSCAEHQLGIWNTQKILNNETDKADKTFSITSSRYDPVLHLLKNGEFAYAHIPCQTIDFFNAEGKTSTLSIQKAFNHHLHLASTEKELIAVYVSGSEPGQNLGVDIFDIHTKDKKKSFSLNQKGSIAVPQQLLMLDNKYLALTAFMEAKDTDSLDTHQIGIWDIQTEQKIFTLNAKHIIKKIIAFPNNDIASITINGLIEYWNGTTFKKYEHEVKLPSAQVSVFTEVMAFDNNALLVSLENNGIKIFYVPPLPAHLKIQEDIVHITMDVVAPQAQFPEIKQIMQKYLGFFAPQRLMPPILENKPATLSI
jgi:hypothetical protein